MALKIFYKTRDKVEKAMTSSSLTGSDKLTVQAKSKQHHGIFSITGFFWDLRHCDDYGRLPVDFPLKYPFLSASDCGIVTTRTVSIGIIYLDHSRPRSFLKIFKAEFWKIVLNSKKIKGSFDINKMLIDSCFACSSFESALFRYQSLTLGSESRPRCLAICRLQLPR